MSTCQGQFEISTISASVCVYMYFKQWYTSAVQKRIESVFVGGGGGALDLPTILTSKGKEKEGYPYGYV